MNGGERRLPSHGRAAAPAARDVSTDSPRGLLGQQPGVLHTLLVAVEAATGSAGPRAPGMLDVGFTRCGPATKTSDERCDGRGRAAQESATAPRAGESERMLPSVIGGPRAGAFDGS